MTNKISLFKQLGYSKELLKYINDSSETQDYSKITNYYSELESFDSIPVDNNSLVIEVTDEPQKVVYYF